MELRSDEYAGGRPELEQRNWGGLAAGQESRVLPIIRRMLESALQPGQFSLATIDSVWNDDGRSTSSNRIQEWFQLPQDPS